MSGRIWGIAGKLKRFCWYYWSFYRLVVKAGMIWGVGAVDSVEEWYRLVLATPLYLEAKRLDSMRRELCGKGFEDE